MDCLELSIRQQVLSDLATLKHETKDALTSIQELIQSGTVLPVETQDSDVDDAAQGEMGPRIFMSEARAHCNTAFGEHVANLSEEHVRYQKDALITSLLDILHDAPHVDYDRCLSWDEWALPDQLVYTTVSALLRICFVNEDCAGLVINTILGFISQVIEKLRVSNPVEIFTQLTPSVHGLYRAITSTIYPWTPSQWHLLSRSLDNLVEDSVLERINNLLLEIHQEADVDMISDASQFLFCHTFISRYVSAGRPLSGYFIVCCVMEMQWTVLAQSLIPISSEGIPYDGLPREAAAANKAWSTLMKQAARTVTLGGETVEALRSTVKGALQCFNDLLGQMEDMDTEPPLDTYAWETMSESLKLASICCVAARELDPDLYARLGLLLSDKPPFVDNLVEEAALKSTTVIVQSFTEIASELVPHLRRFVTSPLPTFEFAFNSEKRAPPPLTAAAKCFALCIKLAPGEDSIMSNMYSLLNFFAAISKEVTESSSQQLLQNPLYGSSYASSADQFSHWSEETGLRGRSDEEKRLIGITTISVVARLALEFNKEEVTKLTISMLLQRLRIVEPTLEAALVYNLADLALVAPVDVFRDIVKAFSSINRVANSDDPRFSNNMVLAAQTRLARELDRRPDLYDIYLEELLTLFSDKGVAIQNAASSTHHAKTEEMIEQLASLLLPIEALLNHADFSPHVNASPELTLLFRNMWLLCVLLNITFTEDKEREKSAMTWLVPALGRIATKTPTLVLESATDVLSDLEYNTNVRHEYARSVISKHRACLVHYIPMRASEIRSLSAGQVLFVSAMHDVETLRSDAGLPSSLVSYFTNPSLNKHAALSACMEAVAEKVIQDCVSSLNIQAAEQALPIHLSYELRDLLVFSTHRVTRAREVANKYLNRLITSFPSLMCDPTLVYAILECLTLLRRACDGEFIDEYSPRYEFYSERTGITLQLIDDYKVRNDILSQLRKSADNWFKLALGRAPVELQSILQKYLAATHSLTGADTAELGASVAEQFAKAYGPVHRQLTALCSLSHWKSDRSRVLASQLASKGYFAGEAAGLRLACYEAPSVLDKNPPQRTSATVIEALKKKMEETSVGILNKHTGLMVQDLKRLLFRCAAILISLDECDHNLLHRLVTLPFEVFTPTAIATGIEVWTWVIAEKPAMEVALMSEVLSAWFSTVRERKGVFSQSLNYQDPFQHPINYVPTDKEEINRAATTAQRLLVPHTLILQMLFSRLQSARYRRSSVMFLIQRLVMRSAYAHRLFSTHPLARELRFSFLLFGFETLKSSHLDAYCEGLVRQCLYRTAYSWFAVQPQWSYGANRMQVTADIKILQEFLTHLQTDCVKGFNSLSSLAPGQSPNQSSYVAYLKNINHPLRLLVENEITRLTVWVNPSNDSGRGTDYHSITERSMLENNWPTCVRTVWEIDPAIAMHMMERFKSPSAHVEVERLVRANPIAVASTPEGLRFLVDDKGLIHQKNDLQYILASAPVSPVIAVTFFEKKYNDNPHLLQYAHRVLKQHPVELTFFFVPQIVQALRFDDLGYIKQFILETAKLSPLFCHQIIWNMKANCYKDDVADIEDPMKPLLDGMIDTIVKSLTGEARSFYDKEFSFFHKVTSISGKLKPFIKKTKPEKKAKIDEEMAKICVEDGIYLPSNPDGEVIDIDKHSGRPLQSHAKAPFMASFKVRKSRTVVDSDPEALLDDNEVQKHEDYEVWQQAIFKVGDDCRQDVLALQVIAMFKNIFTSVGLPLYFYPYRVTATAPGCGVIDVVPNATSRDEMGRAKVNDLLDFFVSKYGGEETVAFQRARLNFIHSMAAYSVACYILQIKDRHNGNIMIDADGHIIHIDFGFLFDIGPGGVKFEPSSFKLNAEMVALMGGRHSQGYDLFQHLTVKGFLALRPHADQLVSTVQLMLGTGLPSFKGEITIKRLKDRFVLGLNDRQASEWMMGVIRNAHENIRSTVYDEFQRIQNGIPYK